MVLDEKQIQKDLDDIVDEHIDSMELGRYEKVDIRVHELFIWLDILWETGEKTSDTAYIENEENLDYYKLINALPKKLGKEIEEIRQSIFDEYGEMVEIEYAGISENSLIDYVVYEDKPDYDAYDRYF